MMDIGGKTKIKKGEGKEKKNTSNQNIFYHEADLYFDNYCHFLPGLLKKFNFILKRIF